MQRNFSHHVASKLKLPSWFAKIAFWGSTWNATGSVIDESFIAKDRLRIIDQVQDSYSEHSRAYTSETYNRWDSNDSLVWRNWPTSSHPHTFRLSVRSGLGGGTYVVHRTSSVLLGRVSVRMRSWNSSATSIRGSHETPPSLKLHHDLSPKVRVELKFKSSSFPALSSASIYRIHLLTLLHTT